MDEQLRIMDHSGRPTSGQQHQHGEQEPQEPSPKRRRQGGQQPAAQAPEAAGHQQADQRRGSEDPGGRTVPPLGALSSGEAPPVPVDPVVADMAATVERMRTKTEMLVAGLQHRSKGTLEQERAKVAALEAANADLAGQLSKERDRAEAERVRAEQAEARAAALEGQLQVERERAEAAERDRERERARVEATEAEIDRTAAYLEDLVRKAGLIP